MIRPGRDGDAAGFIALIGARPLREDAAWEICRMYVAAEARGAGLARQLLDTAEAHARAAGAARLVLWTDTRFTRAHGFYEKRSYVRQGAIRILELQREGKARMQAIDFLRGVKLEPPMRLL